jgi:hypothetical protein
MTRSTKHRFAATALTAAALTVSVPVAQAQSPDAFERAVQSQQQPTITRSPDVIDRAIAAREADRAYVAHDGWERTLSGRPTSTSTVAPDAFERALITRSEGARQTASMLDTRERALGELRTTSSPTPASGGFDWSDFSLGAGAGIGLMLAVLGLATGVGVPRRVTSA